MERYLITFTGALFFSVLSYEIYRGQEKQYLTARSREVMIGFLIELALCLGIAWFMPWFYGISVIETLKTVCFCALIWPCAYIDYKTHLIPNRILVTALLFRAILFLGEVIAEPEAWMYLVLSSLLAAVAFSLASLLCRLMIPGSVGYGDVKLLAVTGLYFGINEAWNGIFMALLITFFAAIYMLVIRHSGRKGEIPFAPCLWLGVVAAAFLTGI